MTDPIRPQAKGTHVIIDESKLQRLLTTPFRVAAPRELRREGNVFLMGGDLPPHETLETLFESHCMAPADLFHLNFVGIDSFSRGEELARLVKKNFSAHLIGKMGNHPTATMIERAYAAGIDIIDIPLPPRAELGLDEWHHERQRRMAAQEYALSILPRWAVVSTLTLNDESAGSAIAEIDLLLAKGILPLPEIQASPTPQRSEEIVAIYRHLIKEWHRCRALIAPLVPFISLCSPLAQHNPGGALRGFMDRLRDRRLLAASDLRRALRVRQVEESFESAGL